MNGDVTLMTPTQHLTLIALAVAVLAVTLELIRRRRLRETYALLWLATGLALLAVGLFPGVLYWLQGRLGLGIPVLLMFLCFVFLTAIVLQYSIVLSRQAETDRALVQELALLRAELERLAADRPADGSGRGAGAKSGSEG